MHDLAPRQARIPAMSDEAIGNVRRLESLARELPQVRIVTRHVIHGGMYARTVCVPANVMITGALVKLPTLLIVDGDAVVHLDGESARLTGHCVLPASAGRKQAFVALADTHITMLFPTAARSVAQAEREFTDEVDLLASRLDPETNHVIITGE